VGQYIEENIPDVKVIYTRKTDVFIPLHERADIANKNKADLFISIHANWGGSTRITGTETFVMGTSADARNREVAMKENAVITLEEDYTTHYEGFDPNSAESYIIFNLMQKTYLNQSLQFAGLVQDQFRERALRVDRGVKQDVFLVLWRTSMPSVLIETGFLTSQSEERYLMSEEGKDHLASAIFRAFRDYKSIIESKSVYTTAAPRQIRDEDIRPEAILIRTSDPVASDDKDVYYMVQVHVTSQIRPLDHESFSNYGHVSEFKRNNLYIYAVKKSTSYEAISASLYQVQEDFPGAFIIAVKEGKIIPVGEALKQNN
jgi:N-acetylmuramoyl-L-alanine amidase